MLNTTPILVDVCWTLYRSNTTFDFLDAIIPNKSYRLLRAFFRTHIGYRGNIVLYRITHIDWQRRFAIRYLKGMSKTELEQKAKAFVLKLEQTKRIESSFNVLTQLHSPIIILSGTLDCIAEEIGKRLQATAVYASPLEYHNGICTGRLKKDILLRKQQYVNTTPFAILTDNTTDIALVKRAEKAFIVCYSNKEWWEKQDIKNAEYQQEYDTRY